MTVWTVGHSTRAFDELVTFLRAHGIETLVDIRTVPRSRRHPHFARESLAGNLPGAGIAYVHTPGLGGLRKPRRDSPNTGWRHESFRGYADYMQTEEFTGHLEGLVALARGTRAALMCAEAVPWRCHRSLVADALVVRDIEVRHITSARAASLHVLTAWARRDGLRLTYPPARGELQLG